MKADPRWRDSLARSIIKQRQVLADAERCMRETPGPHLSIGDARFSRLPEAKQAALCAEHEARVRLCQQRESLAEYDRQHETVTPEQLVTIARLVAESPATSVELLVCTYSGLQVGVRLLGGSPRSYDVGAPQGVGKGAADDDLVRSPRQRADEAIVALSLIREHVAGDDVQRAA